MRPKALPLGKHLSLVLEPAHGTRGWLRSRPTQGRPEGPFVNPRLQVGVPESGIDEAVAKLVARGYKVGRMEQTETGAEAKAKRGATAVSALGGGSSCPWLQKPICRRLCARAFRVALPKLLLVQRMHASAAL